MFRPFAPFGAIVAGLALSGCTSIPDFQPRYLSGRELVAGKCGNCHAIDMVDVSRNPDAPPLRDLFKLYPLYALDEAFQKGLAVGHYDMPRFTLAAEEAAAILAYLKALERFLKENLGPGAPRAQAMN